MYEDLNKRQIEILELIKNNVKKYGYPPSVREIGKKVGLSSSSTVHSHLIQLEKKGYIRRDPSKPRAIEIIDSTENRDSNNAVVKIPILGRVTAGQPILAVENLEGYLSLSPDIARGEQMFALVVKGESMINAGILDKDYVIVNKQNTANNGEIVVALLDDEATVKRFYKEKNHIRLQPENPNMEPIITNDVQILGKVIAVIRKIH
ncbi:MAG TPA: transcriptional repressor LexA [Clostridia bacterium]|jgi:repressor LexA|nr:transcriptional repressor LexA [Clostridia bacterium]